MMAKEETCITEEMRLKTEEEEQAHLKSEEEVHLAKELRSKAEEEEQLRN